MLILSRTEGKELVLGDDLIRITVLSIHGHQVRLGVTAPKEIPVHRREVFERIQNKKKER